MDIKKVRFCVWMLIAIFAVSFVDGMVNDGGSGLPAFLYAIMGILEIIALITLVVQTSKKN
jgi:hypothetical protein